jgi:hypothetical protein
MRDIQPLVQYIQQCRIAGFSDDVIKSTLLEDATWSEDEVFSAFNYNSSQLESLHYSDESKPSSRYKTIFILAVSLVVVVAGFSAVYYFVQSKSDVEDSTLEKMDKIEENKNDEKTADLPPITTGTELNDVSLEGGENNSVKEAQPILYSVARTHNVPYLCKYLAMSFFDELDYFEAKILGNDFYSEQVPGPEDISVKEKYGVKLPSSIRFVKKDVWSYLWLNDDASNKGYKFNYDVVRNSITDPNFTHFQNPGLLVEPSSDTPCERIEEVSITIPNKQFVDITTQLKSGDIQI